MPNESSTPTAERVPTGLDLLAVTDLCCIIKGDPSQECCGTTPDNQRCERLIETKIYGARVSVLFDEFLSISPLCDACLGAEAPELLSTMRGAVDPMRKVCR